MLRKLRQEAFVGGHANRDAFFGDCPGYELAIEQVRAAFEIAGGKPGGQSDLDSGRFIRRVPEAEITRRIVGAQRERVVQRLQGNGGLDGALLVDFQDVLPLFWILGNGYPGQGITRI